MSPTPEPQLLSAERLTEIGAMLDLPRARNPYVTDYGVAADVVEELYDHATAFRQQVAEQLSRLLYLPQIIAEMEPNAARSARYQNLLTRAAATRLGLELPT